MNEPKLSMDIPSEIVERAVRDKIKAMNLSDQKLLADALGYKFKTHPTHWRFEDLSGQKFSRLSVIGYLGKKSRSSLWLCICDCGNYTEARANNLKNKTTQSCGCYKKGRVLEANVTHGMRNTPEYMTWNRIKIRCTKKESKDYPDYGGRGIKVCERWLNSFEDFYADMGDRPSSTHSIDRINNDGNYEPSNCRWATKSEQTANRRTPEQIALDRKKYREDIEGG